MRAVTALLASLALLALCQGVSADGWKDGRASYYGLDAWSIHKGSCGFGYQWPDIFPGFDVAAISDASGEFSGSCGRCYEVKCRPSSFTDGYGQSISRTDSCKDSSQSVIVKAVDNCPCNYPGNYYSNKRWCCGDSGSGSAHMDLSVWAFEKLATTKNIGVMGISFRRVACDTRSSNPAPAIANPSPAEKPWSGAKRPDEQVFVKRFDSVGAPQGAVSAVADSSQVNGRPIVPVSQLFQGGSLQEAKNMGAGGSGSGSTSSSSSASTSTNGCTDTAPADGRSCQQHKDAGDCSQNWLISGNLCRATCGRCTLSGGTASTSASASSSSSSSGCADKAPTDGTTCAKQKEWGNCDESWVKNGGFCQATCGACSSGSSGSSSSSTSSSSSSSDSGCYDKAVPQSISWGDCSKQKDWGKCDDDWLKSGGYCRKTCGLCGSSGQVKSFEGRR